MLRGAIITLSIVSIASCSGSDAANFLAAGGYGDFGATPGGAQDVAYARDLINAGGVPPPEAIVVAGLLSEHDLPAAGPPCDSLMCIRPSVGIAPALVSGEQRVWVQLAMMSGIAQQGFRRPPLDVVVAIDKSSEMSVDMEQTNEAVSRLVRQLRPHDRISIIAFDSDIDEITALGPVGDAEALIGRVKAIRAGGDFDIVRGMRSAYEIARSAGAQPDRMRRIIVLSCGFPYLSSDRSDEFSELVTAGAQEGIGMSFFAVLLGYSADLAKFLGNTAGGASFYLDTLDRTVRVFDDELDTMVTPLAYDLSLDFELAEGMKLDRFIGLPGDDNGGGASGFEVATAFLSKRGGALVARLQVPETLSAGPLASVRLSYRPNAALGWTQPYNRVETVGRPEVLETETTHYGSDGVRKVVALVNQAEMMQESLTAWQTFQQDTALALVDRLLDYLRVEADALDDDGLRDEVALIERLRTNMTP